MKELRILLVALGLGISTAHGAFINQPVDFDAGAYGSAGQSMLFRAYISQIAGSTLYGIAIRDKGSQGGSSGVFSGFDLDFVVLDRDGDWATTADRILPFQNNQTYVEPGVMRKGAASIYQPTAAHPGALFGLLVDPTPGDGRCPVDFATATLAAADASYRPGVSNLTVDTSSGWLSLGDNGRIQVAFPLTYLAAGESLYLFIGDVGQRDEFPSGNAEVLLLAGNGQPQLVLGPGQAAKLDGAAAGGPPSATSWLWDLDGDGLYDDGSGKYLDVTYEYLTSTMGLPLGNQFIGVRMLSGQGWQSSQIKITLVVPEPATWLVLLGAAGAVLKRRRARA